MIGFAPNWSVGAEFNYLLMGTKTINLNAVIPMISRSPKLFELKVWIWPGNR